MISQRISRVLLVSALSAGLSTAAFAQADNTNSLVAPKATFSTWMNDHSTTNQGRISRDAYMQESGRRWDAMDTDRRGLTTMQVNDLYGYQAGLPDTTDSMSKPTSSTNVQK